MISTVCPSCSRTLRVPDHAGGRRGTCPGCRASILIPNPTLNQPATDPAFDPPFQPPPPLPAFTQPKASQPDPAEDAAHDESPRNHRTKPTPAGGNGLIVLASVAVALLFFILAALIVPFFSSAPPPAAVQWEYRILAPSDSSLESTLETAGKNGWELVTARRATSALTDSASYEMIFKRLKKDR